MKESTMFSARNQLEAKIVEIKEGVVNSLIVGELQSKEIIKAIITADSQKALELAVSKRVLYLFKASSIIIAKGEDQLKLSAANQFKGEVVGIKEGMINTEVMIKTIGGDKLSAMVTNKSIKNLALQIGDKVIAMIKASQIIISA
ncbi:MopI, Molybdopterin-binding protein [Helicobacter suis HS1]|nr:MopI, Molybdopterin-binding protein [Helicobacter suis HS1]